MFNQQHSQECKFGIKPVGIKPKGARAEGHEKEGFECGDMHTTQTQPTARKHVHCYLVLTLPLQPWSLQ